MCLKKTESTSPLDGAYFGLGCTYLKLMKSAAVKESVVAVPPPEFLPSVVFHERWPDIVELLDAYKLFSTANVNGLKQRGGGFITASN